MREMIRPHPEATCGGTSDRQQPKQIDDIRKSRPYLVDDQTIIAVRRISAALAPC